MSVIVAVSDGKRVCMASDSQLTNNGSKWQGADPKFRRLTGMGNRNEYTLLVSAPTLLIADWLDWEYSPTDTDSILGLGLARWVSQSFEPALRGFHERRNNMIRHTDGTMVHPAPVLLAHGPDIVVLDIAGAIIRLDRGWAGSCSGRNEAEASMLTMKRMGFSNAEEIACTAVAVASELDDGCSGKCHFAWTEEVVWPS